MTREQLLHRIKEELETAYGRRLKGLVLYGSEARGDSREDSDFDFLVLLEGPVKYGDDLMKIIKTLYPLQLEIIDSDEFRDRCFHAYPADFDEYREGREPLYNSVQREGIAL